MEYVGIDPGGGGGIAVVDGDGAVVRMVKMPETERDVLDALRAQPGALRAALERVHSSPQMGVSSAFTFGKGYGALRMALAALEIPYDEPTPQAWQKLLGCRSGGDKAVPKRRAQELFPGVKVTNWNADALLLAEWCRRTALGAPAGDAQAAAPPRPDRARWTAKGDLF